MPVVQVRCGAKRDEELRAAGIGAGVGHRQDARDVVFQVRVEFVGNLVAGAATTGAGRVAALDHEPVDDPVKNNAVIEAFAGQVDEIFRGDRRFVFKHFDSNDAFVGFDTHHPVFGGCGRFLSVGAGGGFVRRSRGAAATGTTGHQ